MSILDDIEGVEPRSDAGSDDADDIFVTPVDLAPLPRTEPLFLVDDSRTDKVARLQRQVNAAWIAAHRVLIVLLDTVIDSGGWLTGRTVRGLAWMLPIIDRALTWAGNHKKTAALLAIFAAVSVEEIASENPKITNSIHYGLHLIDPDGASFIFGPMEIPIAGTDEEVFLETIQAEARAAAAEAYRKDGMQDDILYLVTVLSERVRKETLSPQALPDPAGAVSPVAFPALSYPLEPSEPHTPYPAPNTPPEPPESALKPPGDQGRGNDESEWVTDTGEAH